MTSQLDIQKQLTGHEMLGGGKKKKTTKPKTTKPKTTKPKTTKPKTTKPKTKKTN
jgi:hypothetical protein